MKDNSMSFLSICRYLGAFTTLMASLLVPNHASAQTQGFPNKPIKLIIPHAAGGNSDTFGRILAQKLSERIGQQVIVENKVGAGGTIAVAFTAKAPADGYTLVVADNGTQSIAPGLYGPKLQYDVFKDFSPITLAATFPAVILIHPSVEAKTPKEFVALVKSQPGKFTFSSAGTGNGSHLALELFRSAAGGLNMVHIPYKGGGPAVSAVLANEVDILITNTSTVLAQIQAGKLVPLGTTTLKRTPVLSSVASISETIPGYELNTWYGLFGPAGLPKNIALRLNQAFIQCLNSPEIKQQLIALAYDPDPGSAEVLAALLKKDTAHWANVIKITGIKAE
jgi:tripartite-type tricarboxylate transporter receptor subunit TctC